MKVRRGEIYYIESFVTTGSEQRPGRPAVVVSNDMNNEFSSTIEVVYFTTQPKRSLPTHVKILSLSRESIALCEQITSVAIERLGDFCGEVSPQELAEIDAALLVSLGLQSVEEPEWREETPPAPKVAPNVSAADLALRCASAEAKCAVLQELYDSLLGRLIKTG